MRQYDCKEAYTNGGKCHHPQNDCTEGSENGCFQEMGEENQTAEVLGSNSTTLLDCKTIQACAELLDLEADRMEDAWNQYIASGGKGPATTYYTIPRAYAKLIRGLAI